MTSLNTSDKLRVGYSGLWTVKKKIITGKLSGTNEKDISTLEFIVEIINGTQGDYTASELQSLFGITQEIN